MYTLRTVHKDGSHTDALIGEVYTYAERFVSYDAFSDCFERHFKIKHVAVNDENADEQTINCIGFVITQKGELIPIYKNHEFYIMHPNGSTFSNLTFKTRK